MWFRAPNKPSLLTNPLPPSHRLLPSLPSMVIESGAPFVSTIPFPSVNSVQFDGSKAPKNPTIPAYAVCVFPKTEIEAIDAIARTQSMNGIVFFMVIDSSCNFPLNHYESHDPVFNHERCNLDFRN